VIACHHSLTIAGRRMDCVHPQIAASFDARAALAYSCNRYFSQASLALSGEELADALRRSGLTAATGLLHSEATGTLRVPSTPEDEQLLALGVDNILVTPIELAESYRWLLLQTSADTNRAAAKALRDGLTESVNFGMASAAAVSGMSIAGKTGTAGTFAGSETHGWFVGYAPAEKPQVIVLVYLPHGRGADAALRARAIFAASPLAPHP
jgi:cell division protein FtsI/penicillin-binding protein 2